MHLCFVQMCIQFFMKANAIYKTLEFPDWAMVFFGWMILTFVLPYDIISTDTTISLILYHI